MLGKRVLDQALEGALERAGAEGWIPALLDDDLLSGAGQLERDLALVQAGSQARELELGDARDLLAGQLFELDDLVDPVQKLGPEELAQVGGRAQV